ncbi:MAG TPA: hypothetical protein VGN04_06255 [Herbaspirillum sp.]
MDENCNNKVNARSEEEAISNYEFNASAGYCSTQAYVQNELLIAYTEGDPEAMHLELTTKLISALESIRYEHGHGAQSVKQVMTLMQRHGAVWREIRDPRWWLKNFEGDIDSSHPDYDRAMNDFSVFLTLFSEYEASLQDCGERGGGPFDSRTPHEIELRNLWQVLRSRRR